MSIALASALALFGAFAALMMLVQFRWEPLQTADRNLSQVLRQISATCPALVAVMQVVTELGRELTWWIVHTVVTVFFLVRRHLREASFVAVTAAGGGLLNTAIKSLTGRERPDWPGEVLTHSSGFAFPSGHTTGTAIGVSVLLIVFVPVITERWRWVVISAGTMFVVAVGASRVILGVHWASDVLGAVLFSATWTLAMVAVFRAGLDREGQQKTGVGSSTRKSPRR